MNIPIKKAQLEGERTEAYLKRFNKKMLKIENLLEPIVIKVLINEASMIIQEHPNFHRQIKVSPILSGL
jgi:hypothetical protein